MTAGRRGMALGLVLGTLALSALACDFSTDAAATALAPTEPPAPGTPVAGGGPLQPGDRISSSIRQQGEEHFYTFQGQAGQAVTIDMEAGPAGFLDSYLELHDPNGQTLLTNDDGGNGLNSRIGNFVLPQDGQYTIMTYGFGHSSTGAYSLTMALGTPMPTPTMMPTPTITPTVEPGGGTIRLGETVTGELRFSGQDDLWRFPAQAGDIVTIHMRASASGGPDTYIELADPYGNIIATDDDGGDGLNSRLVNRVLAETGTYTIHAHSYSYSSIGRYELELAEGVPPPTPGPSPTPYDRPLELGQTVEDTLYPRSAGNRYIFQTDEPLSVVIALQRDIGGSGVYVEMTDFNGRILQSLNSYDSAGMVLSQNVALTIPGTYYIRVYTYEDYESHYVLTLSRGETLASGGGEIAYGQSVSGELVASGQQDEWTFAGRNGDVITVIMSGIGIGSQVDLFGPNGARLISSGSGSPMARIDSYTLFQDGNYAILARGVSGSYGYYRLSLFLQGSVFEQQ